MFRPVRSARTNANIHAISMAAKKDGRDIPSTEKTRAILSTKVSFSIAVMIPMNTPRISAKRMETVARRIVFGKASARMDETFRWLW